MSALTDRLKAWLQYPLPHHFLSRVMHFLTRLKGGSLSHAAITLFVKVFNVKLEEAERKRPVDYESFNDFFTRSLVSGARPLDSTPGSIISPVDGTISQIGRIENGRIFQAKGHSYDVLTLLGGEEQLAESFHGGTFATIYLAPHNYHRIHAPLNMRLQSMHYVPGRLFSVNPATVRIIPCLFARNERVASIFNSHAGLTAVIMVGALFVGSIETTWAGEITPPKRVCARHLFYNRDNSVQFTKGDELARFNMGSTVILLFQENKMSFLETFRAGDTIVMGQIIGRTINSK